MRQTILRSKKSAFTTNFIVCNMERHEAGQEEKLVETFKDVHPPRDAGTDSRCCYKCLVAVVAVMGLVILTILVLVFISYYFRLLPRCKQDAPSPEGTVKVNITCKLKETDEKGRYDIFTVNKAANYLVYGWVKLTNITNEEVILRITYNQDNRTIQKEKSRSTISFFAEVLMVSNNRISIYFNSSCADSSFHVLEL